MAVLYMPNGVNPNLWTPEGEGRDFNLSPTLEPLQDLKDDLLVLTNPWNQGTRKDTTSRSRVFSPAPRSPRRSAWTSTTQGLHLLEQLGSICFQVEHS